MNLFYCPLSCSFWGFVFEMFINSWKRVCFQTLNAFICWPLSLYVVGWARAELHWWSVLISMWWTKCLEGPYGRRSVGDPAKFLFLLCNRRCDLVMLMSCMECGEWIVLCADVHGNDFRKPISPVLSFFLHISVPPLKWLDDYAIIET